MGKVAQSTFLYPKLLYTQSNSSRSAPNYFTMNLYATLFLFFSCVLAARPFLEEPDNGLESVFGDLPPGTLPDLNSIAGLPDFQWAARNYLPLRNFTYYRNAAGGEWSYRNNMEVFARYTLRPRVMKNVTRVNETMQYVTQSMPRVTQWQFTDNMQNDHPRSLILGSVLHQSRGESCLRSPERRAQPCESGCR